MTARALPILLLAVAVAAIGVRLGLWQASRWQEKHGLNAAMRAGLEAPSVPLGARLPPDPEVARRVVEASGRWDPGRPVLVAGGLRREEPVAHVVLPLRLAGGEAILVDRGFLPSHAAVATDLSRYADTGLVVVRGWAEPMRRGAGPPGPRRVGAAPDFRTAAPLSARRLDADSLARHFPYRLAPWVLRELPGDATPAGLVREPPAPLDENLHLGYAIQWFAIAALALAGGIAFAVRERRR